MRIFRKAVLLIALSPIYAAVSADAYQYIWDCRGPVVWSSPDVTFEPSLVSFPVGSAWHSSVNAMQQGWSNFAPGTRYRIHHQWSGSANWSPNDNRNSIVMAAPADWIWGGALAVALMRRSACNIWPFARAQLREADIVFSPHFVWENAIKPVPPHPNGPFNSTLVGLHEHGHGLGLAHEDTVLATMNSFYPSGGVIGGNNDVHPHADDVLGNRVGYGTATTARDVAASTFRRTGSGTSNVIPAPSATHRNAPLSFQFTVANRGTVNQSSVLVRFYLSPDRNITTSDFLLGSATLSLNQGVTATLTANVWIPSNAPTGNRFLGWFVDPLNTIPEANESNNSVALTSSTFVRTNRAPNACFTANPTSGEAPLFVSFNASCSSDPDGDPLTYSWSFGDGFGGSGVTTSHTYFTGGFYMVNLTVTDPSGASSTAAEFIWVQEECDPAFPCMPH
jgi:hypothetical protein